ncbi:MAG: HAMP domain-containing histidine kinase [Lachnospiraceae bacterium]|nr:HAMP domain-containing histidine kinase [Lachnospiraceae bacterium]
MKLWQKIYLITIAIFVVLLDCGIYLVFQMTYNKDIILEQQQAETEFYMLTEGIYRNFTELEKKDRLKLSQMKSVLEVYENYYTKQKIALTVWDSKSYIYPERLEQEKVSEQAAGEVDEYQMVISTENGVKQMQVEGILYEGEEIYYIRYEKPLTKLQDTWGTLEKQYIIISVAFSLGLAVLLFFVLRRMMHPIRLLTKAVDDMAGGNLDSRVYPKGTDDIATLGEHFNEMAEHIQMDMLHIQGEAKAKQQFADNFAHELKSPLTSIYGYAEYVEKGNVPYDEMLECMGIIMEESDRLLHLSYTLLDMAKLRTYSIEKKKIAVAGLFSVLQKQTQKHCRDAGVQLLCHSQVEDLYGNELLLQSLLFNLVSNSIFACGDTGTVSITVTGTETETKICVQDNGCGMTKEQMDRITEPFYRADRARGRKEGRSGLGLSLCQQIVQEHEGTMTFFSETGKGTTVVVQFCNRSVSG